MYVEKFLFCMKLETGGEVMGWFGMFLSLVGGIVTTDLMFYELMLKEIEGSFINHYVDTGYFDSLNLNNFFVTPYSTLL